MQCGVLLPVFGFLEGLRWRGLIVVLGFCCDLAAILGLGLSAGLGFLVGVCVCFCCSVSLCWFFFSTFVLETLHEHEVWDSKEPCS